MQGENLFVPIDEQIDYSQLGDNEYSICGFLVASGYLKVLSYKGYDFEERIMIPKYELALANYEVHSMFRDDLLLRGRKCLLDEK